MANISTVILPAKALKDGRHKIRLAISHNGLTRYIPLPIIIDSSSEFKNGRVVKRGDAAYLNTKLRGFLQQYQEAIDELGYVDGLTCPELITLLKSQEGHKHPTLKSIFDEYMEISQARESSKKAYRVQFSIITTALDPTMFVESISRLTVLKLDKTLSKKYSPSTINNVMTFLKTLLNHAQNSGYVTFKVNPFLGYKNPKGRIRKSWLTVEQVKTIRDYVTPKRNYAFARDMFMLSYYLGGINCKDLFKINFNECTDTLKYTRSKSISKSREPCVVEFKIPDEAKDIIMKYKGKDGFLKYRNCSLNDNFRQVITQNFKLLREVLGIENLIYYSARKSFSQHALELGVQTKVIDYILGHTMHGGGSSLYHYIRVVPDMATKAIRTVLDNLK